MEGDYKNQFEDVNMSNFDQSIYISNITNLIQGREVVCQYNGCNVKMNIESLLVHELDCDFSTLTCSECEKQFLKKDKEDHLKFCNKIRKNCTKCEFEGDLSKNHSCETIKFLMQEIINLKNEIVKLY